MIMNTTLTHTFMQVHVHTYYCMENIHERNQITAGDQLECLPSRVESVRAFLCAELCAQSTMGAHLQFFPLEFFFFVMMSILQ